jgi:broad specificity polyphosphatase/5'/3'-nucleotidase SurE
MTRRQLTNLISINFPHDSSEWKRIRTSEGMVAYLEALGAETEERCNEELHAAQARRKQPEGDGYDHRVTKEGDRARLYIAASTARGMAHEAVNQTILKNIPIGEVKNRRPPDRKVPRELGRRSDAARNLDGQGQRIHRLDS